MDVVLVLVLVAIATGVGLVFYEQRLEQRRDALKRRFGREYDNAVEEYGSPRAAQAHLAKREARMAAIDIRPLSPREYERFGDMWARIQKGFVDDPIQAVRFADALVVQLMQARGYPMNDFERRVEDLSVDHGNVVQHYRAAQTLAAQIARGNETTEDLRQAMIHYRILFADLLVKRERPSISRLSEVQP